MAWAAGGSDAAVALEETVLGAAVLEVVAKAALVQGEEPGARLCSSASHLTAHAAPQ